MQGKVRLLNVFRETIFQCSFLSSIQTLLLSSVWQENGAFTRNAPIQLLSHLTTSFYIWLCGGFKLIWLSIQHTSNESYFSDCYNPKISRELNSSFIVVVCLFVCQLTYKQGGKTTSYSSDTSKPTLTNTKYITTATKHQPETHVWLYRLKETPASLMTIYLTIKCKPKWHPQYCLPAGMAGRLELEVNFNRYYRMPMGYETFHYSLAGM